ncbi:MAG: glycosyltransferase family 2 protein [Lentisphaerae bacterium]|nr:glycosyltransferase family 2 protein [Lentisphaerota bacterium]
MSNEDEQPALKSFTLVLPVWNEREVIEPVVQEILSVPELACIRLLLVDDGSTDGSAELLDGLETKDGRCAALHLPHGGKDRALWAAFGRVETDWLGIMDSDGQYDPRDLVELFRQADTNIAAVWGVRARRHDNRWRKIISRAGRLAKRLILGSCTVQDTGCGIWVAQTRFVRDLNALCPEPAGQVHCHLPELISTRGGRIAEQAIRHRSRLGGQAKYGALNRMGPGLRSLLQARSMLRAASRG